MWIGRGSSTIQCTLAAVLLRAAEVVLIEGVGVCGGAGVAADRAFPLPLEHTGLRGNNTHKGVGGVTRWSLSIPHTQGYHTSPQIPRTLRSFQGQFKDATRDRLRHGSWWITVTTLRIVIMRTYKSAMTDTRPRSALGVVLLTFLYEVESRVKSRLVRGTESMSLWTRWMEVLWAMMLSSAGGPSLAQPCQPGTSETPQSGQWRNSRFMLCSCT